MLNFLRTPRKVYLIVNGMSQYCLPYQEILHYSLTLEQLRFELHRSTEETCITGPTQYKPILFKGRLRFLLLLFKWISFLRLNGTSSTQLIRTCFEEIINHLKYPLSILVTKLQKLDPSILPKLYLIL